MRFVHGAGSSFTFLLLGSMLSLQLQAQALEFENLEFSSVLNQELAVNSNSGDMQKLQTTYQPRLDFELSQTTSLTAIGRVRADTYSELGFRGGNDHVDVELREFYVDTEWAGVYWRLGKQQVVWGQADGLRVLDVINPIEYREFVLPEFEDSRIPLWTLNAEMPLDDDWMLQVLLIPDQSYDYIPDNGSAFSLTSSLLVPRMIDGVPVVIKETNTPRRVFKDADAGFRLSAFLGGWDVSFNYLHHYQDQPVLFSAFNESGVTLSPGYERTHLVGGSFSNVFGDFTFRSEVGYSSDRYFLTSLDPSSGGVAETGEISYVLGLDYQGWRDWFVSGQLFQSYLTAYHSGFIRDREETNLTFLLRRSFLNESLEAESLAIHNLNNDDGVIQLSVMYELSTNIRLTAGADVFYGNRLGLFGQFKENDRVSIGIEFAL